MFILKFINYVLTRIKDFYFKRKFIKALKQDVLYSKWRKSHSLLDNNFRKEVLKNFKINPRSCFSLEHKKYDNLVNNTNVDYFRKFYGDDNE